MATILQYHNDSDSILVTQSHTDKQESVSAHYDSTETLMDHLMEQETVFEAVSLAKEINKLNGYKVVSDYQLYKIKSVYRKRRNQKSFLAKQNEEYVNAYIKMLGL